MCPTRDCNGTAPGDRMAPVPRLSLRAADITAIPYRPPIALGGEAAPDGNGIYLNSELKENEDARTTGGASAIWG